MSYQSKRVMLGFGKKMKVYGSNMQYISHEHLVYNSTSKGLIPIMSSFNFIFLILYTVLFLKYYKNGIGFFCKASITLYPSLGFELSQIKFLPNPSFKIE